MPRSPEAQASVAREKYAAYKQLCRQHDVKPLWGHWGEHYRELQLTEPPYRRLSRAEHYAYWTERLTHDEICELAAYLDFLSFERSDRVRAA